MSEENRIENRVANSGLITFDLSKFIPKHEKAMIDLKDFLFKGWVLREKDFRESLSSIDWQQYKDRHVGIYSSVDAIIPHWAYMLMATYLRPVASSICYGDEKALDYQIAKGFLKNIKIEEFRDQRVVIKGCGDPSITEAAYFEITRLLQPVVKSIMYGEPCSTVPVYKRK